LILIEYYIASQIKRKIDTILLYSIYYLLQKEKNYLRN